MKNNGIVDAQGKPIVVDEDRIEDLNLPAGVQALIETRINNGVDSLREHNHAHLDQLATDHAKKWRILALIFGGISIVLAFWAPSQISGWIQMYVENHMTKPQMEKIADEAIRTKMGQYVDEKLIRVEQSTDDALANVSTLTSRVANLSTDLASARSEFDSMSGDILALRQFFNARRGVRKAYCGLATSAGEPDSDLASALLQDIQEFYRDFKNETQGMQPGRWGREIIHVETLKYCRFPAETIHTQLFAHNDPYQRRAEANDTVRRNLKYFVEDLVTVATNDPNILVASRAVSAIEYFSGKKFADIPPFSDVAGWWKREGCSNSAFHSPFGEIAKGDQFLKQQRFDDAISTYESCVSNRNGLATTHYNLFKAYLSAGNLEKATNSLNTATREADAPPTSALVYARILTSAGKHDEAVRVLARVKPYIKDFATVIEADASFKPLAANEQYRALIAEEMK